MVRVSAAERENRPQRVTLHAGISFAAAWESVILPWFDSVSFTSIVNDAPVAVVTPYRSQAYLLRSQLLANGISLLGVKFLSPAQLREVLLRGSGLNIPLREHLRLLLAIAAEEIASPIGAPKIDNENEGHDHLIAKAVARAPDHFLRAIDRLGAAGWRFDEVGTPALREINAKFQSLVAKCGFELIHDADRTAIARGSTIPHRFSDLLVTGFNGAHWPLWPLLRSAVTSSKRATVILTDPRDEARALDETWIGTWEEAFGAANPISATAAEAEQHPAQYRFVVARDTCEQASAIATLVIEFLAQEPDAQIAIFFPGPGVLPRRVGSLLAAHNVPHNDAIGHPSAANSNATAWAAWLHLQENPRLRSLLRFLKSCDVPIPAFGGLSLHKIERRLRKAYCSVLLDDVRVLREFCARHCSPGDAIRIADGIDAIDLFPERASFVEFTRRTSAAFAMFGWDSRLALLRGFTSGWCDALDVEFSRATYLRWLSELMIGIEHERDADGDHPYSRVHILPYGEAADEVWSHVILAGLNEGEWPAAQNDSGFIGVDEVTELNRRATHTGRHGTGHTCVKEGQTLLVGAAERRQIALRDLRNTVEATSDMVAVTAQLFSGTSAMRAANPSDFCARLYFDAHGKPLSRPRFEALQRATEQWLNNSSKLPEQPADHAGIERMMIAYRARRDPRLRAGKFDFALQTPPSQPAALRATQWRSALQSPALVWMAHFLGVEADEEDIASWSAATGNWVHSWLATVARANANEVLVELLPREQILSSVARAAEFFREDMESMSETAGRSLPDWWLSGWRNARHIADQLARKVAALEGWQLAATEVRISEEEAVRVAPGKSLRIEGRVDLLLAKARVAAAPLWVIDYKTGGDAKLASGPNAFRKQLISGEAIQISLYALAMRERGGSEIGMSLLTQNATLDEPQMLIDGVIAHEDFWREIVRMAETGDFGMLGEIRSPYRAIGDYPIATLPIDPEILTEKWALTHPAFGVTTT